MQKINVLEDLKLGNPVAEYDKNISNYFIDTSYVEDFVNDRYDIVKGVKGAGKTAMLVSLCDNKIKYKSLNDVKLVQAINIKGDPDYKRAFDHVEGELKEQEIIDAWKIYIINIAWKNITDTLDGYEELEQYLIKNKLITKKLGYFAKLMYALKRSKITCSNTFHNDGTTVQSIELAPAENYSNDCSDYNVIDFNFIFNEIDKILFNNDCRLWVMMDRLDDAFPDKTNKSILALKNLLYAYKDMCVYENLKVKIFIREDIFNDITEKGFTSLTHVASKTTAPIKWDRNKLEKLLIERLLFNKSFEVYLIEKNISFSIINKETSKKIIDLLLRDQVDSGGKNPDSIGWIINHIKDGLHIFTPRDFIDLIDIARQYQLQKCKDRDINDNDEYLIGAVALKKAYEDISKQKLEAQIYAEYPELRKIIEMFKDNKAEHNEDTLKLLLGKQWKSRIQKLVDIGFIEEKKNTWKIPFLYTKGLNIRAGKAFKKFF